MRSAHGQASELIENKPSKRRHTRANTAVLTYTASARNRASVAVITSSINSTQRPCRAGRHAGLGTKALRTRRRRWAQFRLRWDGSPS